MKIFLASPTEELPLLTELSATAAATVRNGKVRFTSSSANMSGYGTNLHFENWLFFTDRGDSYLAQKNACIFKAFGGENNREAFTTTFKACERNIKARKSYDVRMMVAPTTIKYQHPYINGMKYILERKTKKSVKVAIHRLTTNLVTRLFIDRIKRNVPVSLVMDDDTYLYSIDAGGFDVTDSDANSMKKVRNAGGDVAFIQTNEEAKPGKGHLHHNKYIIADDKYLFQGAGNFTGKALNMGWEDGKGYIPAFGNYEQFYIIKDAGIVKAYVNAFAELRARASTSSEHPVQQ
ncbi:MAG: hypothetical protein HOM21_11755, partial [Halobacteriovoraceae bacterium]|nr:hypothetical protein [Halobacteriovoraceae bacterium]